MEVQAAGELIHQVEEKEEVRKNRLSSIWGNFVFRRFLRALLTIFLVTTFIFFLVRLLPGDPVQVYINRQMTQYGYSYDDAANQARSLFAFDSTRPLILQYFDYRKPAAWRSGYFDGPAGRQCLASSTVVFVTIFSVGTALLIAFAVGSPTA